MLPYVAAFHRESRFAGCRVRNAVIKTTLFVLNLDLKMPSASSKTLSRRRCCLIQMSGLDRRHIPDQEASSVWERQHFFRLICQKTIDHPCGARASA